MNLPKMGAALVTLAVIGLLGLLIAPSAGAKTLDLRHVNLSNQRIPGSTCFSSKPIQLHKGAGRGGRGLYADAGTIVYGNITGDNGVEAFMSIGCSTHGGTAASQAKFTWVVFTASGGHVKVVGVISGRHEWPGAHASLLSKPRISHKRAHVIEYVYGPADADCCSSFKASSTWHVHKGHLVASSGLIRSDLLITSTGVGRAKLGMTRAQLRAQYPSATYSAITASCGQVAFGREYDQTSGSYTSVYATLKKGRVVQFYPASGNAATNHGVGQYSTIRDMQLAYGVKRVHRTRVYGEPAVKISLPHSTMVATLDIESYGTFAAHAPELYAGHASLPPVCQGQ